jgi:hypothetical protein
MARRVAITIAGAVSLGSYEAGVLFELLHAFDAWNRKVEGDESRKIYIDVLTGASAGAMTAAMVAQRLMYDAAALTDISGAGEPTNLLYEAWVKRIDLMRLVRMRWKEPKWHSLFSSDLIASIGDDMLVASMTSNKQAYRHSAVEAGRPLRVGLSLTNMDGIDYMLPITGSDEGGFNYTTSADQKCFVISGDASVDASIWRPMCDAAVASGAFPAAFRSRPIAHSSGEYDTPRLPGSPNVPQPGVCYLDWQGSDPATFCHCDGGVLQNQPLGIAKNLVDVAAASRTADDALSVSNDRLYVFVSPHSVKSSVQKLDVTGLSIRKEILHLISVYLRQATFHDWITAEEMNSKITVLDERASQLAEVIKQGFVKIPELAQATSDLNALLMPKDEADSLDRLRRQYGVAYDDVLTASGREAAEAYISALATLEAAAHLQNRDKMKIVAVIASETELAGAGLSAFVGFFRKSYRQHDYWIGRCKTQTYLQRDDVRRILGVDQWPDEANLKSLPPNPSGSTMPVSAWHIFVSALIPGILFLAIRWITWIVVVLLALTLWAVVHWRAYL